MEVSHGDRICWIGQHWCRDTPEEVRAADPASLRIPALAGVPVALVTGEVSVFARFGPAIFAFLSNVGAAVEHLHLPDRGIRGNGHGLLSSATPTAASPRSFA